MVRPLIEGRLAEIDGLTAYLHTPTFKADDPHLELHIVPSACKEAAEYIRAYPETEERIRSVGALTDGFESDDGMELLATVHWVCTQEGADSKERAYQQVHSWNRHKQQFSERQVFAAYDRLASQKWI